MLVSKHPSNQKHAAAFHRIHAIETTEPLSCSTQSFAFSFFPSDCLLRRITSPFPELFVLRLNKWRGSTQNILAHACCLVIFLRLAGEIAARRRVRAHRDSSPPGGLTLYLRFRFHTPLDYPARKWMNIRLPRLRRYSYTPCFKNIMSNLIRTRKRFK